MKIILGFALLLFWACNFGDPLAQRDQDRKVVLLESDTTSQGAEIPEYSYAGIWDSSQTYLPGEVVLFVDSFFVALDTQTQTQPPRTGWQNVGKAPLLETSSKAGSPQNLLELLDTLDLDTFSLGFGQAPSLQDQFDSLWDKGIALHSAQYWGVPHRDTVPFYTCATRSECGQVPRYYPDISGELLPEDAGIFFVQDEKRFIVKEEGEWVLLRAWGLDSIHAGISHLQVTEDMADSAKMRIDDWIFFLMESVDSLRIDFPENTFHLDAQGRGIQVNDGRFYGEGEGTMLRLYNLSVFSGFTFWKMWVHWEDFKNYQLDDLNFVLVNHSGTSIPTRGSFNDIGCASSTWGYYPLDADCELMQ